MAWWPIAAAAQPAPSGSFSERVDVDLVQIEVRVTGDDGAHVTGLERGDFQVELAGKKVDLSLFSEVRLAPEPSAEPTQPEPVHLLLLVDQVHLDGGLSEEALTAIGSFLDDVCAGGQGRVAVLEATVEGLELPQPFTSDAGEVLAALGRLDLRPTPTSASAEYRRLKSEIQRVEDLDQSDARNGQSTLSRDEMPFAVKSQIDAVSQRALGEMTRTVLQVDRAISGLAGLPGRKHLVLVTGSLPTRVARELNSAWNDTFGNQSDYATKPSLAAQTGMPETFYNPAAHIGVESADTGEIFDVLARRANAQDVTLHVLGSVINTEASQRVDDPKIVGRMAQRTGGRAVIGPNAHRVLDGVASDLGSYYVLAFSPPAKLDPSKGPFDVEIKFDRSHKGLDLHHRESVLPTNLEQRAIQAAVSALLLGADQAMADGSKADGKVSLEIELVTPSEVEGRDDVLRLPAKIFIPLGRLTFVEADDGSRQGRASLFFTTGDLEQGASNVQKVEVPLRLSAEQLEGADQRSIEYAIDIPMVPGAERLAVAMRDDLSGDITSAVAQIHRVRIAP